jgi:hypothetical protein
VARSLIGTKTVALILTIALAAPACTSSVHTSQRTPPSPPSPTAATQLAGQWSTLAARPLHFPSPPPGGFCPKTTEGLQGKGILRISPGLGPSRPAIALGAGPVYPMFFFGSAFYKPSKHSGKGSRIVPADQPGTKWNSIKTIWIAAKSFDSRVLVRGRQINGSHRVRFSVGRNLPGHAFAHLSSLNAAVQTDQPQLDLSNMGQDAGLLRAATGLSTRIQKNNHRYRPRTKFLMRAWGRRGLTR